MGCGVREEAELDGLVALGVLGRELGVDERAVEGVFARVAGVDERLDVDGASARRGVGAATLGVLLLPCERLLSSIAREGPGVDVDWCPCEEADECGMKRSNMSCVMRWYEVVISVPSSSRRDFVFPVWS